MVLVLIHPALAFSGVIVVTEQDEDKSNFIFLIDLGFMDKLQITLHCLFPDLSMHMLLSL